MWLFVNKSRIFYILYFYISSLENIAYPYTKLFVVKRNVIPDYKIVFMVSFDLETEKQLFYPHNR